MDRGEQNNERAGMSFLKGGHELLKRRVQITTNRGYESLKMSVKVTKIDGYELQKKTISKKKEGMPHQCLQTVPFAPFVGVHHGGQFRHRQRRIRWDVHVSEIVYSKHWRVPIDNKM